MVRLFVSLLVALAPSAAFVSPRMSHWAQSTPRSRVIDESESRYAELVNIQLLRDFLRTRDGKRFKMNIHSFVLENMRDFGRQNLECKQFLEDVNNLASDYGLGNDLIEDDYFGDAENDESIDSEDDTQQAAHVNHADPLDPNNDRDDEIDDYAYSKDEMDDFVDHMNLKRT